MGTHTPFSAMQTSSGAAAWHAELAEVVVTFCEDGEGGGRFSCGRGEPAGGAERSSPQGFAITVRLGGAASSSAAAPGAPEEVLLAFLRYDRSQRRVFLTNPSVYQPIFMNGVRVLSLGEVALPSGCVVEVYPTCAGVPEARLQPSAASPVLARPGACVVAAACWYSVSERCLRVGDVTNAEEGIPAASEAAARAEEERPPRSFSFPQPLCSSGPCVSVPDPHCCADTADVVPDPPARGDSSSRLRRTARRSATQQPPSLNGPLLAGAHDQQRLSNRTPSPAWELAGASSFSSEMRGPTTEAAAAAAAAAQQQEPEQRRAPPSMSSSRSDLSRCFAPLSIRFPSLIGLPGTGAEENAATATTTPTALSFSLSCPSTAGREVAISCVARCVSSGHVEMGCMIPKPLSEASPSSWATTATAALRLLPHRRFSSLVSDTILSPNSAPVVKAAAALEWPTSPVPVNAPAPHASAAASHTLAMLSAHYDSRHQRLRPFSPAERRILFTLSVTAIEECRGRLRHTAAVVRLTSPLFCCGEVNGSFALLWGAVLQRLCPFGCLSLLATPLLFLGNYTGHGGAEGCTEESVHVLLALTALCVAAPVAVHMLRGRNECFAGPHGASLRAQCMAFFGAAKGRSFFALVRGALTALPLAAIVDEKLFASHGGVPSVPVAVSSHATDEKGFSGSSATVAAAPVACLFDHVLAGFLPPGCFHFGSLTARHHPEDGDEPTEAACRCLTRELVFGRASAASSGLQHPGEDEGDEALRAFLHRYGFSVALRGSGGGDAGIRVSHRGRLVSMSASPLPGGPCGCCIVTPHPHRVQLLCWRTESLRPREQNTSSPSCANGFPVSGGPPSAQAALRRAPLAAASHAPHYVMGVPMPLGRGKYLDLDPDTVLTPSAELPSVRHLRSHVTSIRTVNEVGEVEYG